MRICGAPLFLGLLLAVGLADAEAFAAPAAGPAESLQTPATRLSAVVVTATRNPEFLDQIPADLSVVSGPELSGRDARDMASALALVPGVEAPAGGDAGPSSAVPSFWGLHEFDAFLLVVAGVTDPQNLGALLRSAACAGVTGVVLARHRAAHLSPSVVKVAAGAVEHLSF